jgi:hypothetical protein
MNALLLRLEKQGCYPSIYYRGGGVWRAHVNAAGNHYEDHENPLTALNLAVMAWEKAGKPMDGMAAEAQAAKAKERGEKYKPV